MAKERARRRAEREAEAQRERERRAADRARRERRDARRARLAALTDSVPTPVRTRRPGGLLAARSRRRWWYLLAAVAAVQCVVWPFLPGWPARLLLLAACLLVLPVARVLVFGRL